MRTRILLAAVLGAAILTGLTPARAEYRWQPCKNAFSIDQEITEGKKAARQVEQQLPILPDSNPVSQYVQQLGMKLVAVAPGYKWPYEFHVVNDADINAFALPGGPIFINLGTLQAAENEAQLAGVMAHEISHVVQRHATCNQTKQQTPRLLAGLGQLAAGILVPGAGGVLAAQGIGTAAGLGFLRMSREAEKQADLMGVDILYKAGYDPRGMAQFFEVIQGKYGQGGSQFLSDHPNPGNRTEYVNQEIATLPPKTSYIKTSPEFAHMKKLIKNMHAYTAKEIASGAWRKQNGPMKGASDGAPAEPVQPVNYEPNGSWKQLDAARFTMSYPENWVLTGGDESVTIVPQGGIVAEPTDANAIAYGVLVDQFTPKPPAALDEAFAQLVGQLQKQNPGLQESGAVEDVLVNKQPGKSVEFTGKSPLVKNGQQQTERDWLVGVDRGDGSLSTLVFVAPEDDAAALRPTFEQILRSFRVK